VARCDVVSFNNRRHDHLLTPLAVPLLLKPRVSGPAVSQVLAGLGAAGLIQRTPVPADRRWQALTLTATGHRVFRSAQALLRDRFSELLGELPPPETGALARALRTSRRRFPAARRRGGRHLLHQDPAARLLRPAPARTDAQGRRADDGPWQSWPVSLRSACPEHSKTLAGARGDDRHVAPRCHRQQRGR
jgi:hypothetical protein